jgi:hypothetical protein
MWRVAGLRLARLGLTSMTAAYRAWLTDCAPNLTKPLLYTTSQKPRAYPTHKRVLFCLPMGDKYRWSGRHVPVSVLILGSCSR